MDGQIIQIFLSCSDINMRVGHGCSAASSLTATTATYSHVHAIIFVFFSSPLYFGCTASNVRVSVVGYALKMAAKKTKSEHFGCSSQLLRPVPKESVCVYVGVGVGVCARACVRVCTRVKHTLCQKAFLNLLPGNPHYRGAAPSRDA